MLVESRRKLLPCLCELLPEVVGLERKRIPLVLECGEQRRDGCEGRRARSDDSRGVDGEEVVRGQRIAGAGLGAVLIDVLLDESLLVDGA